MPERDEEIGPLVRGAFLPEDGEHWVKADISQQEFRFLVDEADYRRLPGARAAADSRIPANACAGSIHKRQ